MTKLILIVLVLMLGNPAPAGAGSRVHAPNARDRVSAPTPTVEMVAIQGADLVRFDGPSGGRFIKKVLGTVHKDFIWSRPAIDKAGNIYAADSERGLLRISSTGSKRYIAANLKSITQVAVSPQGVVYVLNGRQLIRIWQPSGVQTILEEFPASDFIDLKALATDAAGRLTASWFEIPPYEWTVATRTVSGIPLHRSVVEDGLPECMPWVVVAPSGAVYVERLVCESGENNVNGTPSLSRFNLARTAETSMDVKPSDNAIGFDSQSRLYLLQNKVWCVDPRFDPCQPLPYDASVGKVLIFPDAGGGPRTIPVSGMPVVPHGGVVVDTGGTIYAAEIDTSNPVLVQIPPAGGAVRTIAVGSFTNLTLKPGD